MIDSKDNLYSIFVKEAQKVHQNKYSHPKKTYSSKREKIEIECKKHGLFMQNVSKHLSGQGCPKCGKRTFSFEQFYSCKV